MKPPSFHPAGSVRLFPAAGDSGAEGSQPEWMKELNKKNKERREKAAQEEKLAREMEIVSVEEDKEAHDEKQEVPSGCCKLF